MQQTAVRVVLVGLGGHARNAHVGAVWKHPNTELVGVVDLRTNWGAQAYARDLGIAFYGVSDRDGIDAYAEAYDTMNADVVIVATPPSMHALPTCAALMSGCTVLCEKPPAATLADADNIAQTAEKHDRKVMYGFKHVHGIEAAVTFIRNGGIGDIKRATAVWQRRDGLPPWDMERVRREHGGGALIDLIHPVAVAMWLMGFPAPLAVTAEAEQLDRREWRWIEWTADAPGVEHRARGAIKLDGGRKLEFDLSWLDDVEPGERVSVRLQGTKAAIEIPLATTETDPKALRAKVYGRPRGVYTQLVVFGPPPLLEHELYSAQLDHLVQCHIGAAKPRFGARAGTMLQRIVNATYTSADCRGEWVAIA